MKPLRRILMVCFFPIHWVLVRVWPGVAWRLAQAAERRHWRLAARQRTGDTSLWRQEVLQRNWQVYSRAFGDHLSGLSGVVVEVGCGPAGLITGCSGRMRIGIEPLARQFSDQTSDDGVLYVAARGEALPLRAGSVDALICVNVLDHVPRPELLLAEFVRVLRAGGVLLCNVDVQRTRKTTVDYVLHPGRRPAEAIVGYLRPSCDILQAGVGPGHRNPKVQALTLVARRRADRTSAPGAWPGDIGPGRDE